MLRLNRSTADGVGPTHTGGSDVKRRYKINYTKNTQGRGERMGRYGVLNQD